MQFFSYHNDHLLTGFCVIIYVLFSFAVCFGDGYIYAHDTKEKIASMQCLPDSLVGKEYFTPGNQGLEAKYKARLEEIKKWKEAHSKKQK